MKLFDKVLEILQQQEVQHIYGVPGDAINPMLEALRKQKAIEYIHVAHEESGAFMASAAAKLSGQLQVCTGTVGPGAIHLLNGLYDAKKDLAPVLAIVGQVPSQYLGSDYHQEVDLKTLFDDVADYVSQINNPEQLQASLTKAIQKAYEGPGVSVLVIPHDIGNSKVEDFPATHYEKPWQGRLVPNDEVLVEAVEMLNQAKKPLIFAGAGIKGETPSVLALAEKLQAPIVYSLKAKDMLPYHDSYVAGGLGLLGSRAGVKAMFGADMMLILGSDFPYREWLASDIPVVQVDQRPSVLGRRRSGTIPINASCKETLPLLLDRIEAKQDDGFIEKIRKEKSLWDKAMAHMEKPDRSKDTIHPQAVAKMLSDLAEEDAIFTCDTGTVTVWGARHLYLKPRQRFTLSFNLASMAYALPAAIGAKLHYPERQVIAMSGDGGFNMLMGDFLTAVKYKLPIKVVIFNNHKLGLIKMEQEAEGYPEYQTDLQNPDYAQLAEAMGAKGMNISKPEELEEGLKELLAHDGPAIAAVQVNPKELTIPPKISVEQAVNFGLSTIKEVFS